MTGPDPIKAAAVRKANDAERRGKISRSPCLVCGAIKAEKHHGDYNKPLEVVWLCRKHHMELHRAVGRKLEERFYPAGLATVKKCLRCGYEWVPRSAIRPYCCAKCHSHAWDKEREGWREKLIEKMAARRAAKKEWEENRAPQIGPHKREKRLYLLKDFLARQEKREKG